MSAWVAAAVLACLAASSVRADILDSASDLRDATDHIKNVTGYLVEARTGLEALSPPTALTYCTLPEAERTEELRSCRQYYRNFYSRSDVTLNVVFGYADTIPPKTLVRDTLSRAALIAQLVRACHGNNSACGFAQSETDMDLLTKTITGPDGTSKTVTIRLTAASASTNNKENISAAGREAQDRASRRCEEALYGGLDGSHPEIMATFYVGHARHGRGPDCRPPTASHSRANYWRMLRRLEMGRSAARPEDRRPMFFGLMACDSRRHYRAGVRLAASGMTLASTSRTIRDPELLRGTLGSLNGLLGMHCPSGMRQDTNADTANPDVFVE